MAKITDQDVYTACSNGDGTYSGVKLAQWLTEAVGGKPMDEAEIREIWAKAKAKAAAKKAAK